MDIFRRPGHGGHNPHGVTLAELLVTISILLIILAFLLPVLASARESGRRAGCLNNLAQIGKGMTGYDTNQGHLPGWRMAMPGYTDLSGNHISWAIAILPYIDETDIYDWFRSYANGALDVDDVRNKRLQRYTCPTVNSLVKISAPISYMGNGGTGAEVLRPDGHQYRGDGALVDVVGSNTYAPLTQSLSLIGARDGTASTLLATERTGSGAPLNVSWADPPLPAIPNANAVLTTHLVLHPPALGVGEFPPAGKRAVNPENSTTLSTNPDWILRYPSSRHVDGVCAVFCDGRTQFVSDRIAPWVYGQILTTDRRARSPRAAAWEVYPVGNEWVRYVFVEKDLNPKK